VGSFKPSPPQDHHGANGTGGECIVLHVDRDFTMVGTARRHLQRWLRERGCTSADDAMLVLSELVTNALVHARAGCTIKMHHADDLLRLDVRDPSPAPPTIRSVRPDNLGGRGLRLVAAIAQAWGWEPTDSGKRVWAHVAAPVRRDSANNHAPSTPI
jgi:anti-sigma regulatory factor (Ser/Thr protein kinase)